MAQVKQPVAKEIEDLLGTLLKEWGDVPRVASEIDTWDIIDQLHFTEEWPLLEIRLKRLEKHVQQGHLTPSQTSRYEELKGLIAKNRPILQRIMEG